MINRWTANDNVWNDLLGVDVVAAEAFLMDEAHIQSWLDRFSRAFLLYLVSGHATETSPRSESKQRLIDLLVAEHMGVARGHDRLSKTRSNVTMLYFVDRLFSGKRRDGLELATDTIKRTAGLNVRDHVLSKREAQLAVALEIARTLPEQLIVYVLADRMKRVSLASYELKYETSNATVAPLDLPVEDRSRFGRHVLRLVEEMPERQITNALMPFTVQRGALRYIGKITENYPERCTLFFMREGNRQSVRTYEKFIHVTQGDWIVLQYGAVDLTLNLSPNRPEVVRMGEAIFTEVIGLTRARITRIWAENVE